MKSNLSKLGMLAGLALLMNGNSSRRSRHVDVSDIDTKPHHVSKQGQKYFKYLDGFGCFALNQKNADKKYLKYLQSKEEKE